MKTPGPIFLSLIVLFLASCGHSSTPRSVNMEVASFSNLKMDKEREKVPNNEQKLVKDAEISFQTDDIETTALQMKLLIRKNNAYLSDENRYEHESESGYDMSIRVPENDFDKFLDELLTNSNIRKLTNKTVHVNDVTSEFIDLEKRLKVKKETELHYMDLMKQAHTLTETMALEKQMSDQREEIESMEGRMKYLSNQVAYSSVHLLFSNQKGVSIRFFSELKTAFKGGWLFFQKTLIGITYVWTYIPLFFLARFLYIRYRRQHKARKTNNLPESA